MQTDNMMKSKVLLNIIVAILEYWLKLIINEAKVLIEKSFN